MAQEITLPVKLQLENLQSIVKDMRSQLGNLKVDSSGYKKLEGVINGIEKKIQDMQVIASRPIMNEKQFTDIEKDISHIYDDFTKLSIEAGKIKFSDLKLTGDQQQHLQEFDNKLKNIKEDLKHVEDSAKTAFLGTDLGKLWEQNNPKQATKSFSDITKAIEEEVRNQKLAIEDAKRAYQDYQNTIQVSKNLNSFMRGDKSLTDKLKAAGMLDQIFTSNGKRFQNGGRNALEDWLKQEFSLSDEAIKNITQGSGEKVLRAFTDMQENVRAVLKSEQSRLSANRREAVTTTNNGRTLTDKIANEEAKEQTLNATHSEAVKAKEASAQAEAELRRQEEQTKVSREQYIGGLINQAQSTLRMGNSFDQAKTQLASLNRVIDEGKNKLSQLDKISGKLQGITNFVNRYIGAYAIIRKITQAIRNAFNNIKELDKVITNIAVVTNMTQEQLWGKVGEYTKIAQEYGVMTKDVYTVSQLFYQQGLQTNQVMDLTTETLKMAKIAGMDYTAATNAMTVAVRAFNIEMSEAQQVTDTYSALAAKFAVSSAEIANAMEKTASSAANVGMSLQSTSAFMSVMIQTTRESAQNIGSALKSIISRYGEMKASPASLINVDGEEVAFNKVDTALKSIGISIKDASGQFRDFDDVIMELAAKWDTLDNNTQRYIATVMAGNRQQSRFIALVSNYDELSRAMTTANESENASIVQVAKTMDSLESKTNQMKNAWQQLYLSLNIEGGLKRVYDFVTRILSTFGKLGTSGTIKSLISILGMGTSLKGGIGLLQGKIKTISGRVKLKTEEAETQIQKINDDITRQREMPVDVKVNTTQLDDAETRINRFQGNNVPTVPSGPVSPVTPLPINNLPGFNNMVGDLAYATNGLSNAEIQAKLSTALGNGSLLSPQGRLDFLNGIQADPDEFDGLSASLEKLAQAAQSAGDSLEKSSQAADKDAESKMRDAGSTDQHTAATDTGTGAKQRETQASDNNSDAKGKEAQSSRDVTAAKQGEAAASAGAGFSFKKNSWGTGKAMAVASGITMGARLIGGGLTIAGAQHQDKSTDTAETSKVLTGVGNGLSGAATGASMLMGLGPWGALAGAVGGFLIGGLQTIIDGWVMTTEERFELEKKEAKEASDEALKKQAASVDLKSSIDNLETLRKTMYNSNEDMQKYQDAMNTMASNYPTLISNYDAAGNAIIDLNKAEELLARTRLEAAQAANEAAKKEAQSRQTAIRILDEIKVETPDYSRALGGIYNGDNQIWYNDQFEQFLTQLQLTSGQEVHGKTLQEIYKIAQETASPGGGGKSFADVYSDYFYLDENNEVIDITDKAQKDLSNDKSLQIIDDKLKALAPELGLDKKGDSIGYIRSFMGWGEAEVITLEHLKAFEKKLEERGIAYKKTVKVLDKQLPLMDANESIAEALLSEDSKKAIKISSSQVAAKLVANQLETAADKEGFESAGAWSRSENTADVKRYREARDQATEIVVNWFTGMSEEVLDRTLQVFDSMDEYRSVDEMLEALGYKSRNDFIKNSGLSEEQSQELLASWEQSFIDANQANRDRILKTIYQYDDEGNKVDTLNKDLKGLMKLSEQQSGYWASNGEWRGTTINMAETIADLFDNNQIITKYSDYFTSELLEINELAENGYTELAKDRLSVLNNLAQKLSSLSRKHQKALYGVVTNIDFSSYESIVNAEKEIENYLATNKNMTAEERTSVMEMQQDLKQARELLIFNVVTLAQELTDKVKSTVKDIESILSTNKSGLSLDQALEELATITTKFSDLSFDDIFRYDASLNKYVYTAEGLRRAMSLREGELEEHAQQMEKTAQVWTSELTTTDEAGNRKATFDIGNLSGDWITGEDAVDRQSAILQAQVGEAQWNKYGSYYQAALAAYNKAIRVDEKSWQDFEQFLIEKAQGDSEEAQKAREVLNAYRENRKNTLYGAIDWAKIALGTDYTGTNKELMISFADEMGLYGQGLQLTWRELSDKYLEELYGEDVEGLAAAQAARDSAIYQEHASNLTTAIGEVLNGGVNKYYSVATQKMLENGGYATDTLKDDLEYSVGAATSFLRNMEKLIGTGAVTLEQYNEQAKLILDKVLGSYSKGKLGLDFMSGTIDSGALQNLANTLGVELTDIVDVTSGQVKGKLGSLVRYNALTGTYDIIAKSFDEFRLALQEQFGIIIQKDSKEYIAALKTYNDNRLKAETEYQDNVLEELNKLPQAKNGDRLNLAYIYSILGDQAAELFAGYGEFTEDGILTITDAAKLPEIINGITGELQKAGALLPEEIAKLNDTLLSYFQNISNLIKNGIGGSLSYQNKADLEAWAKSVNPDLQLDFTRTANGFKLSQKSAEALYDELVKVDSISAGIVLEELNKSIEDSITSTKKLKREIQELRAVTESDDFKFMDHDIPSGQNNPLNYYSNWSEAFKVIRESGEAGPDRNMMAYEDFFNMITEMGYLADRSGEIVVSGDVVLKNSQDAADLIEKAASALEFTSDGSVKINLAQIGIDFSTGAKDLKTSVGKGMKDVAKSQIEILDSMIKFLEPLAVMEDLKDIAGEDGIFDITDIFTSDIEGSGFNEKFSEKKAQILEAAEQNKDLLYGLEHTIIGTKSLYKILASDGTDLQEEERKALQAYLNASQSPDFDPSNPNSWQQVLAGMGVDAEFIREDKSKIIIRKGTVIEADPDGNYLYNGHQFKNEEAAIKAAHADNIAALQGISDKTYNDDGTILYKTQDNLEITTSYIETDDPHYTATFQNGESVTASTPEALSAAIRHYTVLRGHELDLSAEDKENAVLQYTMHLEGDVSVGITVNTETGDIDTTAVDEELDKELKQKWKQTHQKYYGANIPAEVDTKVDIDTAIAQERAKQYKEVLDSIPRTIKTLVSFATEKLKHTVDPDSLIDPRQNGDTAPDRAAEAAARKAEKKRQIEAERRKAEATTQISEDYKLAEQRRLEKQRREAEASTQISQDYKIATERKKIEEERRKIEEERRIAEKTTQVSQDYQTAEKRKIEAQRRNAEATTQVSQDYKIAERWKNQAEDIQLTLEVTLENQEEEANNKLQEAIEVYEAQKASDELRYGRASDKWTPLMNIQSSDDPNRFYYQGSGSEYEDTYKRAVSQIDNFKEHGIDDWEIEAGTNDIIYKGKVEVDSSEVENLNETIEETQENAKEPIDINIDTSLAFSNIEKLKNALANIGHSNFLDMVYKSSSDINYKPNNASNSTGPSHAKGTLMGELGPELVVSNGRYFVAGQNGAEFVDLDTDAIVFNHLQTKSLLSKGVSNSRGKAVTSEKNAVAFAHGNVNGGPAQASARQTLNALKQLRAQWEAIAKMDAASLANLGGAGGGGGGGGGDKSDPKAFVKELEIWYNWLQRIAVLEQKITYEQQKRQKIQSDMYAHGQDYARSNMETLAYLREQAVVSKSLYDSQQAYFEKRRAEMNAASNPFSALYTFDEYGQLKYQNGAFQQLANISSRDKLTGQGNYTAADQYAKLVAMGFEKYMQYDSSGNKIDTSQEDWQVTAVQAFWDKMDADKEEMQSLHDSIEEHKKAVLEKQEAANQIMREIEDNQISVEDKVLKAIIDTRQREIDELQKQRDAIEEASQNLINGLSEQLNKEKEMYSSQQNQDELSKLQRQLGILQRSGGSASQIANLQREIGQKQQDAYFEAQQKQIDALQEASDNELQRLDNQIELMKETLEYEKENGLLWGQVYEVMAGTPEQITAFIMEHDSEFWGQSPTKDTQTYRETLFEAQQFKEYQAQMKDGFDGLVAAFKDEAIAKAAREEAAKANANTSNGTDVSTPTTTAETTANSGGNGSNYKNTGNAAKDNSKSKVGSGAYSHYYEFVFNNQHYTDDGSKTKTPYKNRGEAYAAAEAKINSLIVPGANEYGNTMARRAAMKTIRAYDIGGMVDSTGPALLHAKESVLTPEQTSILRNDILSNKPTSLLSLLTDFRDAYNSIPNASDYNSITNNDGVTIEQAIVEMHVSKIANDYDAQRAGENALEKMVQIARKTQGQRIGR